MIWYNWLSDHARLSQNKLKKTLEHLSWDIITPLCPIQPSIVKTHIKCIFVPDTFVIKNKCNKCLKENNANIRLYITDKNIFSLYCVHSNMPMYDSVAENLHWECVLPKVEVTGKIHILKDPHISAKEKTNREFCVYTINLSPGISVSIKCHSFSTGLESDFFSLLTTNDHMCRSVAAQQTRANIF